MQNSMCDGIWAMGLWGTQFGRISIKVYVKMPAQKVLDPEHDPVVKWKLVQRDRSCSRARPIGNGDWTGLTMTISSYGSKIGYQSTNKMCIFAVNRPFLGLVIWARPKESTGRTQRTLDCFHAELVIKSLERLVDFRFFQTSKHRKHRLRLSQGCEKKNWCEKTPSSRYTAPRGKWRLQAREKVSLQNHAALPCCYALPVWVWRAPPLWDPLECRWPPFDQNVFMLKKGHGSPKAVLSISACGHSIGSWVNDVVSELGKWLIQLIPPISGKSFADGIWNMSFNCVSNVVRTTINHPPSPIWPELCLAIPSP